VRRNVTYSSMDVPTPRSEGWERLLSSRSWDGFGRKQQKAKKQRRTREGGNYGALERTLSVITIAKLDSRYENQQACDWEKESDFRWDGEEEEMKFYIKTKQNRSIRRSGSKRRKD